MTFGIVKSWWAYESVNLSDSLFSWLANNEHKLTYYSLTGNYWVSQLQKNLLSVNKKIAKHWFIDITNRAEKLIIGTKKLWVTMATTTIQKPLHPSQVDPRLRRAVYAKYREMLGSKNAQANEMIKQMPAYLVQQNRSFENAVLNTE